VLTADKLRGEKNSFATRSGSSFVNKLVVRSEITILEVKNSGYGRELAAYGIREFVNTKTIWID
jgi:succinate-semialdehyde dehydrogenase/glutarate-semialdehyde dehydrogenase